MTQGREDCDVSRSTVRFGLHGVVESSESRSEDIVWTDALGVEGTSGGRRGGGL